MTTLSSLPELIMDQLKAGTRGDHDAVEAMSFSGRIVAGDLPRDRYVQQLLAYRRVHGRLEAALRASREPAIAAVWRESMVKLPLLERDIAFHDTVRAVLDPQVQAATDVFLARIDDLAVEDPVALLGFVYVLEGSMLGGMILRRHLAEAYGLHGDEGLAYYSGYGRDVMRHWTAFKDRMNDAILDPSVRQSVLDAAREAFRRIGAVLGSIVAVPERS